MAVNSMTARAQQRAGWMTALALAAAIVLGGGGSPAPLAEAALQIIVAAIAVIWLLVQDRPVREVVPRGVRTVALLLIAVPVIQLIPLPPQVWQALPGRALAADALALVDQDGSWRPWSLAPDRTLASLLAILPAAIMVVMAAALTRVGRTRLLIVIAAGALLSLVLGAAQLAGGPGSPFRFYEAESLFLDGFQANHNSTADLLLIGLIAASAAVRELVLAGRLPDRRGLVLGLAGGLTLLIGLGVVLTASRAGIMLLPLAMGASAAILRPWLMPSRRLLVGGAIVSLLFSVLLLLAATHNDALARVVARFDIGPDMRPELWRDSLFAARQYFPFGAGMGDFVPSMLANERLSAVRELVPNRAHNEILELAVEAGIFGLAIWAAMAALVMRALLGTLRRADPSARGPALFAAAALVILALHSQVDYPFRSMALAMLAGACAGLILRTPSTDQEEVT